MRIPKHGKRSDKISEPLTFGYGYENIARIAHMRYNINQNYRRVCCCCMSLRTLRYNVCSHMCTHKYVKVDY